ncbi:hypothetical protein [Sinomicrobium soli]|uniref:hypothetical protein n=1 Tax=Sinomicrobium sp. N-1-3-6 TaxID=2219864 RepID=UPI000DCB76BD|nr:hypothetical protein [Sinomicrobium sp. N-1-3-6]RAV29196.1 hypothetical protein DN748_09765 [Sinomicrobium sp. N-1-3-6]
MKRTDKKSLLLIGLCAVAMIAVLAGLYALSPLSSYEIYRGSFDRKFLPEGSVERTAVLDLGLNSFYLSGITDDAIYVSNYTAPAYLMRADHELKDTAVLPINIQLEKVDNPRQFRARVQPPYIYLFHGIKPAILRANLKERVARQFMQDSAYFVDAIPIDTTKFAIKFHSKIQQAYQLALETSYEPYFKPNYNILEKQKDGLFSVDGIMHYSKELQRLVYIYRYRNQYNVIDQDLNLVNRFNTLDTISWARFETARIESDNSFTLTSQPSVTQRSSALDGQYLYNISGIMSKNENEDNFAANSVVDVYNITNGNYLYSFYIPAYKEHRMIKFKVLGDYLVGIQEQYLVSYHIPKPEKSLSNTSYHNNQLGQK